jgi:CRP/FNR family cyclic AMP-dependent transcriptional regulator
MKEIIRRIEVFSDLDDKLVEQLADAAITCRYKPNEVIVREGEVGVGMYFILSGKMAVVRQHSGAEVHLGEIGANEFVAEMTIVDEKPRSATVKTTEETECVLFTRESFRLVADKHPAIAVRLVRVLTEKLKTAEAVAPAATGAPGGEAAAGEAAAGEPAGKKAVEKKLLDMFSMLYTVKAFTRFSVAVLGCPVTGSSADAIEVLRVGEVSAAILPAAGDASLDIEAYGAGQFQLHVFDPRHFVGGEAKPMRFEPVPIQPADRFRLTLPDAVLTREGVRA